MKLTDAEWKVMSVVWEQPPTSARTVLDAVGDDTGWAYTTVKTLLDRLVEKGALTATIERNTSRYSPSITRKAARRSAVRGLVDRAFEGGFAPLVLQIVHHILMVQFGDEAEAQRRTVIVLCCFETSDVCFEAERGPVHVLIELYVGRLKEKIPLVAF